MAPLTDLHPYGAGVDGVWFNRVHTFEISAGDDCRTVHFPKSCLHCEAPACVTVCPTGLLPAQRRPQAGGVSRMRTLIVGESFGLLTAEHLEGHSRSDLGENEVMICVVRRPGSAL